MRGVRLALFAVLLFFGLAAPGWTEELEHAAAKFGARSDVTAMALSPDGAKLLYIQPGAQSDETLYVVDLAGGSPEQVLVLNEPHARFSWCTWGTSERIVCQVYGLQDLSGSLASWTRLFAISADGSDVMRLTPGRSFRALRGRFDGGSVVALDVAGEPGHILMTREYVKESGANTRLHNTKEGLGVDLVNLSNGRSRAVEPPNPAAFAYIADEEGRVRLMGVGDRSGGLDGNDIRYLYRRKGSNSWEHLSSIDISAGRVRGFSPVAIDSAKDVVYGFDQHDGFLALFTISLDGNETKRLVRARDDVDVDQLVTIGRNGRVVGVSYATERRLVEFFDPEVDRLAAGLAKALPDTPQISIIDANSDESAYLVSASSDTHPGMVYLYEKTANALGELLPLREQLEGVELASMKPVTYRAGDGTGIPGYLTLPVGSDGKNLPAIVMPHGGPESRDELGFDWLVQFFASQGYAVLQPNFRGSAGYGEAWLGRNGYQAWPTAVGDVADAGRWLVAEGIADPERLGIAGWSYGGYAALQSQVVAPDLFKAVVAIAPVTDLDLLIEENRFYSSYEYMRSRVGQGPHVEAGSPARHGSSFRAPVLLVHGSYDLNVSDAHSELMRDRLRDAGKPVEYLPFEGLDHGLVHSQGRTIMLRTIGEFLERNLQ
jgi:dipeptidyl aminopeptidase/acylaminoacyl peptidase